MNHRPDISIESVDWQDVGLAVRRHIGLGVVVWAATMLVALAAAFLISPVYRSEVLLVPAKDDQAAGGLSSALGKFGGLAGLAGISLPSGSGVTQQALEMLKSRGFLAEFISSRNLLPVLFAGDWDPEGARWKVSDEPTLDDGVEVFRRKVLDVDEAGGPTVRISVDWTDRELAAEWANALVATLNERMRQRAIDESARSLQYLEQQLAITSTLEVRQSLYRLMEEQLNRSTLAHVRKEYVFEVLDAAAPADPDRPHWPRKLIVLPLGFFAGLALAALAIAFRVGLSRPAGVHALR